MRLIYPSTIGIIMSLLCQALALYPISKPNCPDMCGNVSIPYPFGIGPDCSADQWYTIVCQDTTTDPPAPFLSSINLETLEISLADGIVAVKQPISILNCSSSSLPITKPLGEPLPQGSPFFISSRFNRLALVGCQNQAWLMDDNNYTLGGCTSLCGSPGHNIGNCLGTDCCQTIIPPRLKKLRIVYKSLLVDDGQGFCGYAFLVDQEWLNGDHGKYIGFQSNISNRIAYAPLVLEWEFDNSTLDMDPDRVQCEHIRTDFYLPSINRNQHSSRNVCICSPPGFDGNPYLPGGGCVDVDECNSMVKICGDYDTCVNTEGGFKCINPNDPYDNSSSVNIAIYGFVVLVWLLIFVVFGWKLFKVIQKRIQATRKRRFFELNGGLLLEAKVSSTDNAVQKEAKVFSSKDLERATDNYNENRILGRGGQGTVYKGMLADGRIVAVKKSKRVEEIDLEVFINEIFILSQVNHRNIVRLLGCCLETKVPLLVYEFIPNGTLFQLIHEGSNEEFQFSWDVRLRIASEVAGALSYLHFDASIPIYHRDIKSANILLDEKYRAKVSDFGISRSISIDQTHLTTRVFGTFGYLDPQYMQSNQFTDKSDVYSFGVVLVELLTGSKPVPSISSEEGRNLAMYFMDEMRENRLFDIVDARIEAGYEDEVVAMARLAKRCLQLDGKRRPTMKEVSVELENIKILREGKGFDQDINHGDGEKYGSFEIAAEVDDVVSLCSE